MILVYIWFMLRFSVIELTYMFIYFCVLDLLIACHCGAILKFCLTIVSMSWNPYACS